MSDDWQRRVDAVWAADLPDDDLLAQISSLADELDERGHLVRDDEVFEDGSRKAVGR